MDLTISADACFELLAAFWAALAAAEAADAASEGTGRAACPVSLEPALHGYRATAGGAGGLHPWWCWSWRAFLLAL